MDKAALRRELRRRRDDLSAPERADRSRRAAAVLLERLAAGFGAVGLFASIATEIDTRPIFVALRARGVTVAMPRCRVPERLLDFVPVNDWASLAPGAYDIPEPSGAPTAIENLQAIVVPGLAFDRRGRRLGYGGGYYDRTLVSYSGCRIGLGFATQLLPSLPAGEHDLTLDAVVTDDGAIVTGKEARCWSR